MKGMLIGARYLALEQIGSGGEARVFRARDTATENDVAVRVPNRAGAGATSASLPAFHEGWVRLLDSGIDSACGPYQIFELLEGTTLSRLVARAPLERDAWFSFVNQSLDAVGALHNAGLVHGDLNAENFIRLDGDPPRWKLLELPFLRFEPPAERSTLFGDIHTLAPEQFEGAPPDVRSDLYALGALYYYAAAGEYPHAGATGQEVAVSCLRFAPIPLAEKAPRLPAPWSEWVMTLLARDPQKRFVSAAAAHQLLMIA